MPDVRLVRDRHGLRSRGAGGLRPGDVRTSRFRTRLGGPCRQTLRTGLGSGPSLPPREGYPPAATTLQEIPVPASRCSRSPESLFTIPEWVFTMPGTGVQDGPAHAALRTSPGMVPTVAPRAAWLRV